MLAYEVASQLRAAGEEVSLLLMIDAPTQSYLKSSQGLDYQAEASTLLSLSEQHGWLAGAGVLRIFGDVRSNTPPVPSDQGFPKLKIMLPIA